MSFLGEVKRRKVFQVAAVYAVVAWLLVQIVATVEAPLSLPDWFDTAVIVLLAVGFPITLIISWAFNLTSEGLVRESGTTAQTRGRTIELLLIAVVIVAVGWLMFRVEFDVTVEDARDRLPNSIAVLPCDNLSPDPDNAFFAASLHEEILNRLVKLRALEVIARTSVLQYADAARSIPVIADELRVESVMECSVSYAEGRVAISAQLINGETGLHVWSERYQREFKDVFGIQADIAMNVANALEAEFSEEEQLELERQPTDSPAAYALFLQAWNLIGTGQALRIHELLDQAIDIDPEFAAAYGAKARRYAQDLINTTGGSGQNLSELEPLIRQYADRALALDPKEVNALGALGNLASYTWRWTEATEAYERAFDISDAGGGTGIWFFAWSGKTEEAVAIAERWVTLDPFSLFADWIHATVLNYAGDYEGAVEAGREGIALAPASSAQHSWLAMSEIALGNFGEARRELEIAEQLLGANRTVISLVDIAYGFGRLGDIDNARRLFDEISAAAERGQDIGAGSWAAINLAVGDTDQALEWLERGADKASRHELDAGYFTLMNIRMNYSNDPILEQPEFVDVRDRLSGD